MGMGNIPKNPLLSTYKRRLPPPHLIIEHKRAQCDKKRRASFLFLALIYF
jgi:hypothetical protein